jgi:hypothetical protein
MRLTFAGDPWKKGLRISIAQRRAFGRLPLPVGGHGDRSMPGNFL